jgi:hypothetical protein
MPGPIEVVVVVVGATVGSVGVVGTVAVVGTLGVVATVPFEAPPPLLPRLPATSAAVPPTRTPASRMQVNGWRAHWSLEGSCTSTPLTVRTDAHPAIDSDSSITSPTRAGWRMTYLSLSSDPRG